MQGKFSGDDHFIYYFDCVAKKVNALMTEQGFNQDGKKVADKIAHAHSELSEAFECSRAGDPNDKDVKGFSGLEVQLADVLGILMDMQVEYGLRIGSALLAKMDFNNEHRGYLHGKEF